MGGTYRDLQVQKNSTNKRLIDNRENEIKKPIVIFTYTIKLKEIRIRECINKLKEVSMKLAVAVKCRASKDHFMSGLLKSPQSRIWIKIRY